MSIALAILSLASLAADEPPRPRPILVPTIGSNGINKIAAEPAQVSYEIRVVDLNAAEWRQGFYRSCKRVGREGRSTVWTIEAAAVDAMLRSAHGDWDKTVVLAPKVTAFAGAEATIKKSTPRYFCVDLDRVTQGPADQPTALAFRPQVESVAEGCEFRMTGQRTTAGVRTKLKIQSTWVADVAKVKSRDGVVDKLGRRQTIQAQMEIPQVVETKIDGDYEIPEGSQLLVSLGTITKVDPKGKPYVMERLALIAAQPIVPEAEEVRVGTIVRPMPPLPRRMSMVGEPAAGENADLPPLPDVAVERTAFEAASAEPRPSPQAPHVAAAMHVDPAVARASVDVPMKDGVHAAIQGKKLAAGQTETIHIPLGGKIAIELKARVVPDPDQK